MLLSNATSDDRLRTPTDAKATIIPGYFRTGSPRETRLKKYTKVVALPENNGVGFCVISHCVGKSENHNLLKVMTTTSSPEQRTGAR
ncbi:hypothetical protein AVEN_270979-1 [Araneus ventricosus]|uniref:Uncharacterized protein n=1 Tax=Araneus ventricosus TaxID=182803 RepID=A0A4Y2UWE1_ARAVE|nr:hypothetical protein AVEN_270979-1 [Araneus ventricosus]